MPEFNIWDVGAAHGENVTEVLGSHRKAFFLGRPKVSTRWRALTMLFNVYLEEALGTDEMVRKEDLLVFADNMQIFTQSKVEITQAIQELDGLSKAL